MQALTLPARRGWRWLFEGFGIFRKNALMLSLTVVAYLMLMVLINTFPIIGKIAATLLMPVFSVSLMNACRTIEQNSPLQPQILFSGFHKNLRPLLVLGAVYVAVGLALLGVTALVDGGVVFRFFALGQVPDQQEMNSDQFLVAGQVALVLFSPLVMAYWYAPALVAWHDVAAGKSLFFSFVACARNWRVFLVYCATILVFGALIPGLLAGLLISLFVGGAESFSVLLTLLTVLIFLPVLYASFYVSYRDVFVIIDEDA